MYFTLGSSLAQPARRCQHPRCTALARRFPDELSYSFDQYAWVCPRGHRTADRGAALLHRDHRRDDARLRFEQELERFIAVDHHPAPSTSTDDVRLVELLQALADTCAELVSADAVGVLLTDAAGRPRIVAAAGEVQALRRILTVLGSQAGPLTECIATALPVTVDDVERLDEDRWPHFARTATASRFRSMHAAPIRLDEPIVGSLGVLARRPDAFGPAAQAMVAALIDVASIGLLQQRLVQRSALMGEQLQAALETRVVIEQAKGVLSARSNLSMEAAYAAMRRHARTHEMSILEVARGVLDQTLDVGVFG